MYLLFRLWNQGQFHSIYFNASPMPPITDIAVNLHALHPVLSHSISHPNFDFVRTIINAKNNEEAINRVTYGHTPLCLAVLYGQAKMVKLLLTHPNIQVNSSSTRGSPLYWATYHNKVEIIKLLLAHPDLQINATNEFGETALFAAVSTSWNNIDSFSYVINLLAIARADSTITNKSGETVFDVAQRNHFTDDKLEVLNQIFSKK